MQVLAALKEEVGMTSKSMFIVIVSLATSLSVVHGFQRAAPSAEAQLRQTISEWQQAFDSRNAKAVAAFFSEDAFAMYGLPQPTIGRQANEQVWIDYYRQHTDHPVTADDIQMSSSGDMAYVRGTYLAGPKSDSRTVPAVAANADLGLWIADRLLD